MNALWIFSEAVELVASIAFFLLGVSGSLYAYGFTSARVTPRRFGWRPEFKNTLRWLAPLVALLALGALLFQVHDLRTSYLTPNHCIQATPDCACVFFLSQGSGAPDAERSDQAA